MMTTSVSLTPSRGNSCPCIFFYINKFYLIDSSFYYLRSILRTLKQNILRMLLIYIVRPLDPLPSTVVVCYACYILRSLHLTLVASYTRCILHSLHTTLVATDVGCRTPTSVRYSHTTRVGSTVLDQQA